MPEGVEKSRYQPCETTISRYVKTMAQPNVGLFKHIRGTNIIHGDAQMLSPKLRAFVEEAVNLCQPENIHICDGSDKENDQLLQLMQLQGTIQHLPKYKNCWLARTNPADVARVENRTFISTPNERDTIPQTKSGKKGSLGNWISPTDMDNAIQQRFPGCMKGRTMYIIPFSMCPVGSPFSKIGVEITDSPYVVSSMRIMCYIGTPVLDMLANGSDFVKCLHSVGKLPNNNNDEFRGWPCDPEKIIILHRPENNEIVSYGSGYGGNSLLGKKCLALRIGSTIAKREGWLAEHMLILGITDPAGKKRYIVGAFPSACGKTNLAMLEPTLPGYKVECIGDDIAWMRFDKNGQLRAMNPESGFFGVAPGTSMKTNPNAMKTIFENTIFTNVASTSDGGVYWEGLEKEVAPCIKITDWQGRRWHKGSAEPAAHPNSRFCTPAAQCPIIDPAWDDPEGVPIDAILFGGRRPVGVPLVYEAFSWQHGVFLGAALKSEATAAAEHKGKIIMHDPFAMRPFLGYNFGHYLAHWLSMESRAGAKLPKIFHVNWFRKNEQGQFLWPGFGENSRVLDWILKRVDNEDIAEPSPIGYIPKKNSLILDGLSEQVDIDELFSLPKDFWKQEVDEIASFFEEQVGEDLPEAIAQELKSLKERVDSM